jgi:hypothetical protein
MELTTHSRETTNRRYDRDRISATSRVAILRFGGKNGSGKQGE